MKRTLIVFVLSALALTGCGGEEAPPAANQADIGFAQQMVPHHRQAVEMAELVPERTGDQPVRELAQRIRQAQEPEIRQLEDWLREWGAPARMEHGEAGHAGMPGMMPADEMDRLKSSRDAEFDRGWLTMMVRHHEGAIDMATAELRDGSHAGAKELAQRVIDAQRAEITTMRSLLGSG
ncbi:DUF305 domain-containing protein [Amycolatopsis nigrescens]|uniref:DUF305 domain-containing protein n=1 Tax=Amycolatopsis nigrescens TaxID=381445 RepID=UPI0004778EC4|nr:DUF305 domain-containing protein [Amycolatopsis nigrescens]